MSTHCPMCGRPLSELESVLAERDAGYQCRHCWNRIQATGPVSGPRPVLGTKKEARRSAPRRQLTATGKR
jgi:DNA-directed RNA polymerase subunit RPC12/RpoP